MKENKYDNEQFFKQYSQMNRSVKGLSGAGEWPVLKAMLPDLKGKRVLDLGCGFGWHCQYAIENGAALVVGVDISEKMLARAKALTKDSAVTYIQSSIEAIDFPPDTFDVVISSLAFHYLASFEDICVKVRKMLVGDGDFVFSAEHPIFTAYGSQGWYMDHEDNRLHWPVDNYFCEGQRQAVFLGERVTKYHKTLTTYLNTLLELGFLITGFKEPEPSERLLEDIPDMKHELRRPMFILVSAKNMK